MESLMHYVWQHRLFPQHALTTVDGLRLQIIDPGQHNNQSGPDFFNAKVMIDGKLWAGDVEIHVKASDWHRHGHDGDKAYDSVILHVVDRDDTLIRRSNGEVIPQMRMPCEPQFHDRFMELVTRSAYELPCTSTIRSMSALHLTAWIDSLAYERMYAKAERIIALLERTKGDWLSATMVTMARALGSGINGEQMERLALSIPSQFISKHSDSLTTVEAMLFGQSGFLDNLSEAAGADPYVRKLQSEYAFIAHKFSLQQPRDLLWKTKGMRPQSFPHRRIATLAALLSNDMASLHHILEIDSLDQAMKVFSPTLSAYWQHRYTFGAAGKATPTAMSRTAVTGMVINTVVPVMMAWGITHDDNSFCDRAAELLQTLPTEHNSKVEVFTAAGIKSPDAFTSQALIELRREYCEPHKCLYCRIGHRMLSAHACRPTS